MDPTYIILLKLIIALVVGLVSGVLYAGEKKFWKLALIVTAWYLLGMYL